MWMLGDVFFGEKKNNAKKTVKPMKREKRGRKVSKERKFGRLQKRAKKGKESGETWRELDRERVELKCFFSSQSSVCKLASTSQSCFHKEIYKTGFCRPAFQVCVCVCMSAHLCELLHAYKVHASRTLQIFM